LFTFVYTFDISKLLHYTTLFKVITLPTFASPDKFAQYIVDFPYFGLQVSQRAYVMLTEAEYSNCKKERQHHYMPSFHASV